MDPKAEQKPEVDEQKRLAEEQRRKAQLTRVAEEQKRKLEQMSPSDHLRACTEKATKAKVRGLKVRLSSPAGKGRAELVLSPSPVGGLPLKEIGDKATQYVSNISKCLEQRRYTLKVSGPKSDRVVQTVTTQLELAQ